MVKVEITYKSLKDHVEIEYLRQDQETYPQITIIKTITIRFIHLVYEAFL